MDEALGGQDTLGTLSLRNVRLAGREEGLVCQIIVFVGLSLEGRKAEETMNIKKWRDEYIQYMKEVPIFNFIKGLWNLRKRR